MYNLSLRIIFLSLAALLLNTACSQEPLPSINCVMTDQPSDNEIKENTTFTKDDPMVYLICKSDQVKKGQNIKVVWIAVDTNNVAPANYKIDEKGQTVSRDLNTSEVWKGEFSLSKPTNGWPAGSYRADLMVNDRLAQSYQFTVK